MAHKAHKVKHERKVSMNTKTIAQNIERDVMERWGWLVRVSVSRDGHVNWVGNREYNVDRYDMYPGMSRQQADDAVMTEIMEIIKKYIPGFRYISYEQSGRMHYCMDLAENSNGPAA
jgi:hypothetical protein